MDRENLEQGLTTLKNSTVSLIVQILTHDLSVFQLNELRASWTDLFFSITEQNYCCLTTEPYKSTDVQTSQTTATVDGRVNETGEQTDRKNNDDRSKTKRGGGRDGSVDAREPTSSLGQRLQFDQQGDKKRPGDGSGKGRGRKKPRFPSN